MPNDSSGCKREFIEFTLYHFPNLEGEIVPANSPSPYRDQIPDFNMYNQCEDTSKPRRKHINPIYRANQDPQCSYKKNDVTSQKRKVEDDLVNDIKKSKCEAQTSTGSA